MNQQNLDKFKELLLKEREKIILQLNFDKEQMKDLSKNEIGDIVDQAFNMYEKNRAIQMSENEKKILLAIEQALKRIENKVYGKCIRCHREISMNRLDAIPWALTCVNPEICNTPSSS